MRGLTYAVHHLLHMRHRRIRCNAMTQIEDQWSLTQRIQNSIDAIVQSPTTGNDPQGIEIALNCATTLQ